MAKASKKVAKGVKAVVSFDNELTSRLTTAEDALIGAVKLFSEHPEANRRVGYLSTLVRAQEAITGLLREELVRERGPQKRKGVRRR